VDLVLMLHVLYYVSPEERKQLFSNLHERWLSDGGFVVVASSSRTRLHHTNAVYTPCIDEKRPLSFSVITSVNIDQFEKFFHRQIPEETLIAVIEISTST